MQKILLIHSDWMLGSELAFILRHSGFQVVSAVDDRQAVVEIYDDHFDLVVMAEATCRSNGDGLFLRIRQLWQVPIIIVGEEQEEIAGIDLLEVGADAYLTSPVNFRELLARVRSLLRRGKANATEFEGR